MNIKASAGVLAALVALGAASACDDDNSVVGTSGNGGMTVPGGNNGTGTGTGNGNGSGNVGTVAPAEQAAVFAPSEVASVVFVINQGEVEQAQLALQKAVTPEARAYAQRMLEEHTAAITRLTPLLQTAGVVPESDPTAASLAQADRAVAGLLAQLPPGQFDFAYMTAQVSAHAKAVALVERTLVPSITNAGTNGSGTVEGAVPAIGGADVQLVTPMQTELTALRPHMARHLVEALNIHRTLKATIAQGGGLGAADAGTGAADAGTGGTDAGSGESDAGDGSGGGGGGGEDLQ